MKTLNTRISRKELEKIIKAHYNLSNDVVIEFDITTQISLKLPFMGNYNGLPDFSNIHNLETEVYGATIKYNSRGAHKDEQDPDKIEVTGSNPVTATTTSPTGFSYTTPFNNFAGAIAFLKRSLSILTKTRIKEYMEKDPENWIVPFHFSWGRIVRNMLRDKGFGEKELGIGNLDDVYVKLIEEAVKD